GLRGSPVVYCVNAAGETVHDANDLGVASAAGVKSTKETHFFDEAEGDVERHTQLRVNHHFRSTLPVDRLAYQGCGGLHGVDDDVCDRAEREVEARRELQHRIVDRLDK